MLLAAGLVCGWLYFFGESDETVIRRNFQMLADSLDKSGQEGILMEMEHAKTASRYFADVTDVRLSGYREAQMTRENIIQNVMLARRYCETLHASIYDLKLSFDPEHTGCTVLFTAMVTAKTHGGEKIREVRELEARLRKVDGHWLIDRAAFREVLKR